MCETEAETCFPSSWRTVKKDQRVEFASYPVCCEGFGEPDYSDQNVRHQTWDVGERTNVGHHPDKISLQVVGKHKSSRWSVFRNRWDMATYSSHTPSNLACGMVMSSPSCPSSFSLLSDDSLVYSWNTWTFSSTVEALKHDKSVAGPTCSTTFRHCSMAFAFSYSDLSLKTASGLQH